MRCARPSSGLSVGLVEKDKLGGTCLHVGCIPTKALLHAAEVADPTRESEQFGVRATLDGIDMAGRQRLQGRRRLPALQGPDRPDQGPRHHRHRGRGPADRAARGHRVDGSTAHDATPGKHVVLASGSYARSLPGLEIDGERVLTSEHALRLDRVPASVVVLGGGVIGCEFASVWRELRRRGHDRRGAPPAAGRRGRGVVQGAGAGLQASARSRSAPARRFQSRQGHRRRRRGHRRGRRRDRGRAAAGRRRARPVDRRARLRRAGRRHGARLRAHRRAAAAPTSTGVYAVGDIVPGLQLAHRGFQQGIFVAEDIAGLDPTPIDETGIPRVTYCHPEVASVGLDEAAARAAYGDDAIETLTYDLGGNGKSQILDDPGLRQARPPHRRAGGRRPPGRRPGRRARSARPS